MLPVTKIQHFCTKDGPGIRTTVFLKGCPLKCIWCHNPEAQSGAPDFFYTDRLCVFCGSCAAACPHGAHRIYEGGSGAAYVHEIDRAACSLCDAPVKCTDVCPSGALEKCCEYISDSDIISQVTADAAFYGEKGGVTFSGGEPTLHARTLIPLLRRFHGLGINTAVETCGFFDRSVLQELIEGTDLFLWDIKDTDNERHLKNTGVPCADIIDNLRAADGNGAETVLRCIMIRSVNFNREHIEGILSVYASLKHCRGIELIPYHTYGASKYAQLGNADHIHRGRTEWIPDAAEIAKAEDYMRRYANIIHN